MQQASQRFARWKSGRINLRAALVGALPMLLEASNRCLLTFNSHRVSHGALFKQSLHGMIVQKRYTDGTAEIHGYECCIKMSSRYCISILPWQNAAIQGIYKRCSFSNFWIYLAHLWTFHLHSFKLVTSSFIMILTFNKQDSMLKDICLSHTRNDRW